MNRFARKMISSRGDGRNPYGRRGGYSDSRRGRDRETGDGRRGRRRDYGSDYEYEEDMRRRDYEDYDDDYDYAGGTGIDSARGDGRGDRGGSYRVKGDFYGDRRDSLPHYGEIHDERDMNDFAGRDYGHGKMKLKKADMMKWKMQMENADGTMGEHFEMHQVRQAAEKVGVKYDGYDEKEFCLAMNFLYSDFCEATRSFISKDNELALYAKMAKAFLEDEDAPEGSEKLALYYYCIVDNEEE